MFQNWQQEKALTALVDAAQAVADRLASAKPHQRDGQAAHVRLCAARHLARGQDLYDLAAWTPAARAKFVSASATRVASLRKQREYDISDGLAVWLHTARALAEPRIAAPVREIWQLLAAAGPNSQAMAVDLAQDAGVVLGAADRIPAGFGPQGSAPAP